MNQYLIEYGVNYLTEPQFAKIDADTAQEALNQLTTDEDPTYADVYILTSATTGE